MAIYSFTWIEKKNRFVLFEQYYENELVVNFRKKKGAIEATAVILPGKFNRSTRPIVQEEIFSSFTQLKNWVRWWAEFHTGHPARIYKAAT